MFTNHEKRDFTFKDSTNINKIGFEVFNFDFGVVGEDYWLELANGKANNNFHANQVLPPTIFYTSGMTDFELDIEKDSFLKNCTIKQEHSTIEISELEKYTGTKSLKFAAASKAANSNSRPEILVPCNYEQGKGIFSFKFFVTDIRNQIQIRFDSFLYITISKGEISVLNEKLNYEKDKWNEIKININFGDAKIKSTYDIELNGVKKTGEELSYTTLSDFKIQMVQTYNDTFIDDLICKTDYKIPNYFRDTFNENAKFMGTETFESLFSEENNNNINNSEDNGNNDDTINNSEDNSNNENNNDNNNSVDNSNYIITNLHLLLNLLVVVLIELI